MMVFACAEAGAAKAAAATTAAMVRWRCMSALQDEVVGERLLDAVGLRGGGDVERPALERLARGLGELHGDRPGLAGRDAVARAADALRLGLLAAAELRPQR